MMIVAALYKFASIEHPEVLQQTLQDLCAIHAIKGTLLLAKEGINGTVAGTREAIDALHHFLENDGRFGGMEYKESVADSMPFYRLKVKVKKEIVTMGIPELQPATQAGTYVTPEEWNQMMNDPDSLVVDTRNDYEVAVGTFEGAINPNTKSFREFPAYVDTALAPHKEKKILMFCTGGIRCEKSTAYLKSRGFEHVYHLKGGILNYLKETPESESKWKGECFVFDQRVTVDHQVAPGAHALCYGCRMPITDTERASEQFEEGVSCPHCFASLSEKQKARARERQRQVMLAAERGEHHIGRVASSS